jgi:DTW domain-containing protein YfiP
MAMRSRSCVRCQRCKMREDLCICAEITLVSSAIRVVIVMHKCEVEKSTSTARLLRLILPNCSVHVVGVQDEPVDLNGCIAPDTNPVVLYPELGCEELSEGDRGLVRTLIVPDGTWTQAKKIVRRRPELWALPKRQLPIGKRSEYTLRRNQAESGVCTAEAVARALGILDSAEVQGRIEQYLRLMVGRVEWSRRNSKLLAPENLHNS